MTTTAITPDCEVLQKLKLSFKGQYLLCCQLCKRDDAPVAALLFFVSGVYHPSSQHPVGECGFEFSQALEVIRVYGGPALDLQRLEFRRLLQQQVHFVTGAVPIEFEVAAQAVVVTVLQAFDHDQVFE